MRTMELVVCLVLFALLSQAGRAVTLTFDDVPPEVVPQYWTKYGTEYGIGFNRGFYAADHTASTWGPPHSGSNVLAWSDGFPSNCYGMDFGCNGVHNAYAIGGYFSTQPGVVLQMIGYHMSLDNPVAWATIGDSVGAWDNVYVHISSSEGINEVEFRPVTTDALAHFCADDITVTFVPEPSSAAALLAGLAGLGAVMRRRRRG